MIDYTYLIFMLPALIFSLWAQAKVKSAFAQASRMPAPMTGAQAAQMVMDQGGRHGGRYRPHPRGAHRQL